MNAAALRSFRSLHTWVALGSALVLFLVFCAGSLTVFHPSIQHWENPAARHRAPEGLEQAELLLERVLARHPELKGHVSVLVPSQEHPRAQAYWFDGAQGAWVFKTLDTLEGPGSREHREGLAAFLDELHHSLGLGQPGLYALGGICLLYALALLSGVLIYLPQMKKRFLSVSLRGGPRRFWGDLHGVLGLLNLPFHLVFALTGVLFAFFMVLVMSLDVTLFQGQLAPKLDRLIGLSVEVRPAGAPAPMRPLGALVERAQREAPGFEVEALRVHHWGDANARVEAMGHRSGSVGSWGMLLLDGHEGRILGRQLPGARDGNHAVLSILYGLHFGDYGGALVRWIYFLLGLSGAALFLSGLLVWIEARWKRSECLRSTRITARIVVGFCGGTLAGIAALFPLTLAARFAWPSHLTLVLQVAFAAVAGLGLLIGLLRPPAWSAYRLLGAAGILALLCLPADGVFSVLAGHRPDPSSLALDAVAAAFGILLLLGARGLKRHASTLPPDQLWS